MAQSAIHQKGRFDVALSGGQTPKLLLQQLRQSPDGPPLWPATHFWFGDERCVPPSHTDSNFAMANEALLRHISYGSVHRMQGELEPQTAANNYAAELRVLPQHDGWPVFDLIMLGLGGDGHIASLFPNSDNLCTEDRPVSAALVPSLNCWRLSLTLPVIRRARSIMLMAVGSTKQPIITAVLKEGRKDLPVSLIANLPQLEWFLDEAAAAGL